jgi:peptidoglycan/LPS O-acetylase OafA/YrhL
MDYRREIDGLRAVAVLPVVFFHAGFGLFQGGYVGVDIFFVISGYLITSIIREDLKGNSFSIAKFYERRARRILPGLFLVMFASLAFGIHALMPDELKNFGQSLVATTMFSNNILLAFTSGYWDLASEFKPLLHTWSLGVEEQYYFIVPIMLWILWRATSSTRVSWLAFSLAWIASILAMLAMFQVAPNWAFYSLPTRAWEILLGALVALYLDGGAQKVAPTKFADSAALLGLTLIVVPILTFNESTPGLLMIAPTFGTALIILFATKDGIAHSILANRGMVFIGLLSYSIYLWHQPIFAFTRVLSREEPAWSVLALLVPVIFLLSYLSWKFVEKPFRNRQKITTRKLVVSALAFGAFFVGSGIYLNATYGLISRVYGPNIAVADMDKRVYNERVFSFKQDRFSDDSRKKILVVGNSFARDFVNMTLETFDTSEVEIVYRDDLKRCIQPYRDTLSDQLFSAADVVVFTKDTSEDNCVDSDLDYAEQYGKQMFFVGSKDFGYNLNWLIWESPEGRENRYNSISSELVSADRALAASIPAPHYISLIEPVLKDGHEMPITDSGGRMLSTDRKHLTKFGAIYFGDRVLRSSTYASSFE